MRKCLILFFILNLGCVYEVFAQLKTNAQKLPGNDSTLINTSNNNFQSLLKQDSVYSSYKDSLNNLQKKFENFEYGEVIKGANNFLIKRSQIPTSDLLEILRMKGISHFSLSEDEAAKSSFIEILKIDTSYVLDSLKTSPKIVSFFNNVKKTYLQQLAVKLSQQIVRIDTIYVTDPLKTHQMENGIKKSVLLSLVYPGTGHLYDGQKVKGWTLTALTTLTLASSVYFFIDANKKKNTYLDEKNALNFDSKYSDYNKSYKYRNYSLMALGVVWLYSQLDLLFFSESQNVSHIISEKSTIGINPVNGFNLNLKLNF